MRARVHRSPLIGTPEYAALVTAVRAAEQEELGIGTLVNKGANTRDIQLQMGGMEQRLLHQMGEMPGHFAQRVEAPLTSLSLDLANEHHLGLDRDYLNSLDDTTRERCMAFTPVGSQELREERLAYEARLQLVPRLPNANILAFCQPPPAPPPTAGLAPIMKQQRVSTSAEASAPIPLASAASVKPAAAAPPPPETALVVAASKPMASAPIPPAPPPNSAISTTVAKPIALAPPTALASTIAAESSTAMTVSQPAPEIGTEAWRELPDQDRIRQSRALYDTLTLTGLDLSGVPGMLRNYLHRIAPLDRTYHRTATRGYSWRAKRYAGKELQDLWSALLNGKYEPILCRVLQYSDVHGVDIWVLV